MRIRLIKTMQNLTGVYKPGLILEIDDAEAEYLIRRKAAVKFEVSSEPEVSTEMKVDVEDSGLVEDEEITEEELAEIREELKAINGVSAVIIDVLIDAGYQSLQIIADAKVDDLVALKGVGKSTALKIIASAQELID